MRAHVEPERVAWRVLLNEFGFGSLSEIQKPDLLDKTGLTVSTKRGTVVRGAGGGGGSIICTFAHTDIDR